MWLDTKVVQEVMGFCRTMFPVAKYATSYTPTYPLGQLGYVLCSIDHVSGGGMGVRCEGEWDGSEV